jgi:hypothetical protein
MTNKKSLQLNHRESYTINEVGQHCSDVFLKDSIGFFAF